MCNSKRLLTIAMVPVMLLTLAVSASAISIGTAAYSNVVKLDYTG